MTDNQKLKDRFNYVVKQRKAIGEQLTQAKRSERTELLTQHREIKNYEYELELQIALNQLKTFITKGTNKQKTDAQKRVKRLSSRLKHDDWLNWTRSIWKFKEMESRAKTGFHPAQFSSKIPERVIKMFSFKGDIVLDPFVGSGTTCIEALRCGRKTTGVDVNENFLKLANSRIEEEFNKNINLEDYRLHLGDARDLSIVNDESVQLIITHPPYWNCVKISDLDEDLSNCNNDSYQDFLEDMRKVIKECYRVLEMDRVAAFMVGDVTRKVNGVTRLFPLHADLIQIAQDVGFVAWDIYIVETKMRNSGGMPMMGSYPYPHKIFAQFAHNYLLIFRKPV